MKKLTTLLLLCSFSVAHAGLQALDNHELQAVEAQAGADLSLKLSLNHRLENGKYVFDESACNNLAYCRLAISVNRRFVDANNNPISNPTIDDPAHRLWLVFKGIQGTIDIQKLGLDGVDLVYGDTIKPAIQLSYQATSPILIRNFGFNALAIEQDDFTSYIDAATGKVVEGTDPNTAPTSGYGYLKNSTYTSANAPNSTYDHGKETGFMGLRMNGNLALQGTIKVFGCDGSHPRC
ncbi:hypothetical protein EXE30_08815 [Acinetobacter halotolerans]|uniref:Uncharacterized protein n=1 Tax=Acinetobacter halotolerans TaxID=1752076 RepID=A0A4Q6X8Z1_9GAMM|nr:hypothetical protein [Acinetobacter halotolerans]RZF52662.1 hypothetical protein EXE30_08815 [Acinetobacter halotolerans]